MNKQVFILELKKSLQHLPAEEQQDILRDMDEYFHEATLRGLSEEEITEKLGSPKKISDTIIAEAKIKKIDHASTFSQKMSAVFGALIAILILAPFNFIFVFIPLLLISLLLIGFWPIAIALFISVPFVLVGIIIALFVVKFKLIALAFLCFFAIGWGSMVIAVALGLSYLTLLYFKGVTKLFQWNINFIKNRMRN